MTAKEFLSQALTLDKKINDKLEQVRSLRELAQQTTISYNGSGIRSSTRNLHAMENTMCKIVDMEDEINADIDKLVELKAEIFHAIRNVENIKGRLILEERYLMCKSWDDISRSTGYNKRHLYRLHGIALAEVVVPKK